MNDRRLFDAYSQAWDIRRSTGLDGEEMLLDSFAEFAPGDAVTVSGSDSSVIWLEAWRRGTPPRKLARFAARSGAESLTDGLREIADILTSEYPSWMDVPRGLSKISKGWLGSDADVTKVDLLFVPASRAAEVLERCMTVEPNGKGFRKVPVWLDVSGPDDTSVFVGEELIGHTTVDASLLQRMKKKTRRRAKRKVPDGTMQFVKDAHGELTFRRLRVSFPVKM